MSKRFVSLLLALALLCMAMSALGEQEAVEITVGSTNQMSGHFFTDMWGNNTADIDVRALLDSSVCLMDGRSPLEIELPGPLNLLKKPLLKAVQGTVVEKLLRDHNILRDGML